MFHGATYENFFIERQKLRNAGMLVQWAEKYLRKHGAIMGLVAHYDGLPEPTIYDPVAEQCCSILVNRLPLLAAADACT